MIILVTGKNGQLGSEFKQLVSLYKRFDFIFSDIEDFDLANYDDLENFYLKHNFDLIINCAAYTSVDMAEHDKELAFRVNDFAVGNLVKLCLKNNLKLIHISTDYVFDGLKLEPYNERDVVNPQGVYGLSKLSGELKILNSTLSAIIIRTSWLYSSFGNNFVKTMLKLSSRKNKISVVFDQIGTPTYARDLAKACLNIIESKNWINKPEVFHYSNLGSCSWYDFAKKIFEFKNISCIVEPISTKEFPTKAERPKFSVLDKQKIIKRHNISIPFWDISLKHCLNRIK